MNTDTVILSTAWINQPELGERPARTLLIGAATLTVSNRFGTLAFDLAAHSTTVTCDQVETMKWLADRLQAPPARLLLWRAGDIVVPSLIAAAETARDAISGARLLRQFDLALTGEVIDVADSYGGSKATSFDAIAHQAGLSFVPMTRADLAEAHRTGCHGAIRDHLAARAKATWRLWLNGLDDATTQIAATTAWDNTTESEVQL